MLDVLERETGTLSAGVGLVAEAGLAGTGDIASTARHADASLAGVDLDWNLLDANDLAARQNRQRMDAARVHCLNMMSSPGSGKTTLLEHTVSRLAGSPRLAVIEGDMTTELDAERIRACGASVAAITTGRSCHLEAEMIQQGLNHLEAETPLEAFDLVVIENVGNLICPAAYDLGEHSRVVLIATTEGEDKPLKYPYMFDGADCVVITKLDIAPYLKLDVEKLIVNIRQINSRATILAVSADTGEGMDEWMTWLLDQVVPCSPAGASQ